MKNLLGHGAKINVSAEPGIQSDTLRFHPKVGSSWEGFTLEEVISSASIYADNCYYWRTQTGAELDLLVFKGGNGLDMNLSMQRRPK